MRKRELLRIVRSMVKVLPHQNRPPMGEQGQAPGSGRVNPLPPENLKKHSSRSPTLEPFQREGGGRKYGETVHGDVDMILR